jgi:hypothetical protein
VTIFVGDVVSSARDVLLDPAGATWVDATMFRWFNDVLAAAADLKRDINPQVITVPLVAGSVQQLPATALQILEPLFNTVSGNAVTEASMTLIARRLPGWRSVNPATDVTDMMTDERSPVVFHVYPPNVGNGNLTLLAGVTPVLPASALTPTLSTSTATVPIPDHYRMALVDGIVSKALGANTRRQDIQKATFYWQKFEGGILAAKVSQPDVQPVLAKREEQ